MEYVQKGDVDKISALTNRGLDPNFIDRATGGKIFFLKILLLINT